MRNSLRRVGTVTVATGTILVMAAGPAMAHFCYNTKRSEQGNRAAAGSNGWQSFADAVRMHLPPASCPAGIQLLATAAGVTPTTLILEHSTLAQGTFRHKPSGPGNAAVSYLDFAALEAAIPQAIGACA